MNEKGAKALVASRTGIGHELSMLGRCVALLPCLPDHMELQFSWRRADTK